MVYKYFSFILGMGFPIRCGIFLLHYVGVHDGSRLSPDCFAIRQLSCNVVVGFYPCEWEDKQLVCFEVDISCKVENEGEYV